MWSRISLSPWEVVAIFAFSRPKDGRRWPKAGWGPFRCNNFKHLQLHQRALTRPVGHPLPSRFAVATQDGRGRMLQRFPKARKSRLASVAGQEFSHGAEGFGADVVFNAFGIDAGGFGADA